MKLITTVVTPTEFDAVKKALDTFGVAGLTIAEVFRRDITGGRDRIYRGPRFYADLFPMSASISSPPTTTSPTSSTSSRR
jgi:nitrogen regulatory protein P-II 1